MSLDRNSRTVIGLVGVVVLMGGLAWAAVPFYSWFCKVTGYGGTTSVAAAAPGEVLDRTMRVHFDANIDSDLAWTFRPMQRFMDVRLGESAMAYFEAVNTSDVPLTGTASYNVAPETVGAYFSKIHCFCFDEQTLQPGERVEMPVSFFVDPELDRDVDTTRVREITLSYTFHRTEPKKVQARLDLPSNGRLN